MSSMTLRPKLKKVVRSRFTSLMDANPDVRKNFRFLPKTFAINIVPPHNGNPGKRYRVKLFGESKVYTRHLLWKLLFQGVSAIEWLILYREFEKQLKEDPNQERTRAFGMLLGLATNTRKRLISWSSSTRSIFQKLRNIPPLESSFSPYENLLFYLLDILKIPDKGENVKTLYSAQIELYYNKKPIPVNRVGVGYKDKGTLSTEPKEVPDNIEIFAPDEIESLRSYLDETWIWMSRIFLIPTDI